MKFEPLHTDVITPNSMTVIELVDRYITRLDERSIVAISAKVVAFCQGEWKQADDKNEVAIQQAQYYLEESQSQYHQMLTIARGTLLVAAGVDESNAYGGVVMLPVGMDKTAEQIHKFLCDKFKLHQLGVIIVDSASRPLRIGTVGTCLASAGFREVKDYSGQGDVFGRDIVYSQANHAEALAALSVAVMGEGSEQTPLCVSSNVSFVEFGDFCSTHETDVDARIRNDLFAPLLKSAEWKVGKAK